MEYQEISFPVDLTGGRPQDQGRRDQVIGLIKKWLTGIRTQDRPVLQPVLLLSQAHGISSVARGVFVHLHSLAAGDKESWFSVPSEAQSPYSAAGCVTPTICKSQDSIGFGIDRWPLPCFTHSHTHPHGTSPPLSTHLHAVFVPYTAECVKGVCVLCLQVEGVLCVFGCGWVL